MLKGICAGSLAGATVAEKLDLAAAAGFEAVEFATAASGAAPALDSSEADLQAVRATAAAAGLQLSSTLGGVFWQYSLTADDPAVREQAVGYAGDCLRVAKALGAGCVLIVPAVVYLPHGGEPPRQVAYDAALERAREAFDQIAAMAEETGVDVGIENVWNGFLLSPCEFAAFVDGIGSPRVGAYFDVGNILPFGDPVDWIRILGTRIKRVHVKDFKRSIGNINGFVPLLSGDVPWEPVVNALREIGYSGPLTAEMSGYRYHSRAVAYHTSTALDYILGRRS
ncbi:MAG: sugar phosphate isomerase/epimerase [Fimbriimonadaceae bacterium]|nr:sugar phosphate isomerase/epimerase [Fimbriimonadaceae bacterium]